MRGYAWSNMYLSSIQNGIQGWHANNEILAKYRATSPEFSVFLAWAKRHKTLILLNGGYADNLIRIEHTLTRLNKILRKNPLQQRLLGVKGIPFASFREEVAALNAAMTSVFAVLPETCFCQGPQERQSLMKKMADLGYYSTLDAAESATALTLGERFKLLSLSGNLAQ